MAKTNKQELVLKVKKLQPSAHLPTRHTSFDAGLDLSSNKKEIIPSNTVRMVNTGLALEIPEGYYGQIAERSGFSTKNTLKLKAGVVDSGYRGEVKIIFQNCGDYPVTIDAGAKIAQLILLPVPECSIEEVTELSDSERGEKGIGSSDA